MRTLSELSYSELQEIVRQVDDFKNTYLFKLFQEACYGNEQLSLHHALHSPVSSIETFFKRETELTNARAWSEMSEIFESLKSEAKTLLELKQLQ
jgi:hypothetical protein